MNQKKVALVVASYNREKPLGRLLQNLLQQTLPQEEWEVIVVLDGSTDGSKALLDEWCKSDVLPLRYFEQKNTGQAGARHNGIQHTHAQTIVVIDDDMDLLPTFLEAHAKLAATQTNAVGIGKVIPRSGWQKGPLYEVVREQFMADLHAALAQGEKPSATSFITQNVSFPSALYNTVGGFDPSLRLDEDRELGVKLERAGAQFFFLKDAAATHLSDIGSFEKWEKRQFEYGKYAIQVWQKHGFDVYVHPLRNYCNGNKLNALATTFIAGRAHLTNFFTLVLRYLGEFLRGLGFFKLGLATHKLIISLQYHQGVATGLGGWQAFKSEAQKFKNNPARPLEPTGRGKNI